MSRPQAIAGVSTQVERTAAVTYPSISAGWLGQLFGSLYELIPVRIGSIKLSHLIFPLPLAPLTTLIYLGQKALGETYEITNHSVRRWQMALGTRSRMLAEIPLGQIAEVAVEQAPGQVFFKAADLYLLAADGSTLGTLKGVVHPATFRQTILKAKEARGWTDAALSNIQSRQPA